MRTRLLAASAFSVSLACFTLILLGKMQPAAYSAPDPIQVTTASHSTSTVRAENAPPLVVRAHDINLLHDFEAKLTDEEHPDAEMMVSSSCVYPLPDGLCAYHGDLHNHTSYSDGQATPQEAYQMARANSLDFLAITDHAFMLDDDEWNDTHAQAQAATIEDEFVALRGFEWTSRYGHLTVFNTNQLVRADDPDYGSLDDFYAWLSAPAQINSIAQFNHPYHPSDAFDNLAYDRLADLHISSIEINAGDSLLLGKYKMALNAGWHVAPANNSDAHRANWGERRGRTGVVAPGLTYHHIINALRMRRIFSTQDENLVLAMRADGYWMGSVIRNGPIQFDIYAFDPDPDDSVATLELYENGSLLKSTAVNTNTFAWSFSLSRPPSIGSWWYVKAIQSDGDQAYTSPIWSHQPEQFDVLIRDNIWDVGEAPSLDPSWQSPDIWIRRQADGGIWHETPIVEATNHVYARVQNIGSHPLIETEVYFYWASPSLGLVWPSSWNPVHRLPFRIPYLAPGETAIVSIPWYVRASVPKHVCLLVRIVSAQDPILYEGHAKWDNNIAWRNIHIVDVTGDQPPPGTSFIDNLAFQLANPFAEEKGADVHFYSSEFPVYGSLTLQLESELFERWMATAAGGLVKGAIVDPVAKAITITTPADATVYGLPLQVGESSTAMLVLRAPLNSTLSVHVTEQIDGEEIGGNLFTTPSSRAPRKIDLRAATDSAVISQTVQLTAFVVADGFIPVPDGTEVQFSTTLGSLSANAVQTRDSVVTVTLNTDITPGTAIIQASVGGTVTAATAVNIYRTCWARLNDDPTDYVTVQAAVDASTHPTDVVKIAGYCNTINTRDDLAQVVYFSKTLTVRGGYTNTQWATSDPLVNPTTLDAQGQGRVLYITGDISPTIEGLHIIGGNANGLGGGPLGQDAGGGAYAISATATIKGNWVLSNTAAVGGGVFISSGDATLVNNIIAENQALETGSGLYIAGSSSRLWHTTIARNGSIGALMLGSTRTRALGAAGDGTGIYVTNSGSRHSTVALTNTILVSQAVGLSVAAGNTATLEATLWANSTDSVGPGHITTGTINIWDDPIFTCNPRAHLCTPGSVARDYHIGFGGAALNAGVVTGVANDIDTDLRTDGHPDLGADELQIAFTVSKYAAPHLGKAGAQLTYTIQVTNAGDVDLHATITDVLPTHITPGKTTTPPAGRPIQPGGTLTWTPIITAPGGTWKQTVVVTPEAGYAGPLTNVVQATTKEGATGVYTETSTAYVEYTIYLPALMRDYSFEYCTPRLVASIITGPEPRQVALDTAGRRAFVAHAAGVTVIDTSSFVVITATHSPSSSTGITYDPDRDRIWVTRKEADRVVVLDGSTYATLADLATGAGPYSVAYNPANDRVYVTNYWGWTVSVYNAETLTHLTELTDVAEPAHVAVNPFTNKIYVANHRPDNQVTVIDGTTHSSHRIQTGLIDAYGVTVDTTRNLVYVTAIAQGRVAVIDAATEKQIGYVDIRRGDGDKVPLRVIAVNPEAGPEGHLFLVTSSEDGARDQLLLIPNGWPTFGAPVPLDIARYPMEGIAVDPIADHVWVTSVESGLVSVIQNGEPVCSIPFAASAGNEGQLHADLFPDR